jgi:thiol-disulfide isomerase/thioredoxin
MTKRREAGLIALLLAVLACGAPPSGGAKDRAEAKGVAVPAAPAAPAPALEGPRFVPGAQPVAPFVAEQLLAAPAQRTLVYVGASWCEPCRRFHDAVQAGELDTELRGVRFIEYDFDVAKDALAADGYTSRLIPLFAVPAPDGRASARAISGSIKGEGAVRDNILPRLQGLLAGE